MSRVLIPIDGSENSLQAVRQVVADNARESGLEVHLLHVCTPFSGHETRFSSRVNRERYHREVAEQALQSARELLNQHQVPYAVHIELGHKAETINRVAQRLHVDKIVMGTSRRNSLTRLLENSVTNHVLETAHVPVELIAGAEVSKLERYGVLAAVGAALAALLVAAAD